ncbi:MAG: YncE family protein [Gemmatimonadota bacterium]|nr:YncE family protein [Gemmatimonadota bacterium]
MTKSLIVGLALSLAPSGSAGCASAPVDNHGREAPLAMPALPSATAAAGPFVYIANQEAASVSVIDMSTHMISQIIDLEAMGFGSNAKPHDIAVEPDGSFWYVSLIAANRVLKFDRDNEMVANVEFERPGLLALHPTEDWLFVGRSMAAVNPPQRIGRIDRSTMKMEEFDVYVPRPHALEVSPNGSTVYVGSLAENTIVVVDAESGEADLLRLEAIQPHVLVQFAISPDGSTLVATGELSASLLVFDITGDMPRLVDEIDVGARPWHPTYTPDGGEVWFGTLGTDAVAVVSTSDWSVSYITGDGVAEPHGSGISPDGRYVFVSNRNTNEAFHAERDFGFETPTATLVVIDASSREIVAVVEIPPYGAGVGLASRPR